MRNRKKYHPFNNEVEYGLRTLVLLLYLYPETYDLTQLVYLDYLLVHSGDFNDDLKSLHAPIPYRKEEIYIRRSLIENGINLFSSKGLIDIEFNLSGINYRATEEAQPFVDSLVEDYTTLLKERAEWIAGYFSKYRVEELSNLVKNTNEKENQDIVFKVNLIRN